MEFFLPDILKTTFRMDNSAQRWTQSGHFFPKSVHFFSIFKKSWGGLFSLLGLEPVNLSEYASMSPIIPKYTWKYLNKLFRLCLDYAWSSYMFDRLLKMARDLNKPGFWIWHGYIYKGYTEFQIFLIMVTFTSIMPKYLSICLNVP